MLVDTGSSLKYILLPITWLCLNMFLAEYIYILYYILYIIYYILYIPHVYLQVMAILFNFELQYVMTFLACKNLLNP